MIPQRFWRFLSPTATVLHCRCGAVILTALLALSSPALGHHSVLGQFDVSKTVMLKGTISKVDWINPHVYVFLEVEEASGRPTTWALSTIPIAMLRKAGISREKMMGKPGEVVTVIVNPALSGRQLGWINRITYADGHFYALFE